MLARVMEIEDLPQVIEIEENSFPTPWTMGLFLRELKLDYSYNYVFCSDDEVIGYITFWLVADEVHIMSLAVKEEYRKMGLATQILKFALNIAERLGEGSFNEGESLDGTGIDLVTSSSKKNMGGKIEKGSKGTTYLVPTSELDSRALTPDPSSSGGYAYLEVRESNVAAISLYRKLGFEIIMKRPGYYTDTREDALIMGRRL